MTFESGYALAQVTHVGDLFQTRSAWADRYDAMREGETMRLINGLGQKTVITRTATGLVLERSGS